VKERGRRSSKFDETGEVLLQGKIAILSEKPVLRRAAARYGETAKSPQPEEIREIKTGGRRFLGALVSKGGRKIAAMPSGKNRAFEK